MWLQKKYIGLISSRLDGFKTINNRTYNFRCPICGDSQKNKRKARGFIISKENDRFIYYCHNCNISMGFDKFLENIDPSLFREFIREKMVELNPSEKKTIKSDVEIFAEKMKTPKFIKMSELKSLKKISQLDWNHPAKKYIVKRKIPNPYHAKLFYAPKFKKFVNSILPNKIEDTTYDEPRLIIPFLNEQKNLIGFQGRSFSQTGLRYITIMLGENNPKIFNLDECDRSRIHYIFEGPIDSMFVKNSIAMAGGSIDWTYVNDNSVFVYDNEPRSKETCKKISKVIEKGYKVVIFPSKIKEKDINDMILSETVPDIDNLLSNNISYGLEANLLYNVWRKVS